jgi:hypothetical protein
MHKKSQVQKIYREFSRIFMVQHRKLFQDSNIPKSYLAQIRGFSWHKNEIKMIRRGYYSSNNFQDSNKTKITCRWISCRKNTGYHATDPKIRTQGAERGRSWIAMKHGDRSLESSNAQCTAERHRALPRFRALVVR